jgi:hypothetical protein
MRHKRIPLRNALALPRQVKGGVGPGAAGPVRPFDDRDGETMPQAGRLTNARRRASRVRAPARPMLWPCLLL